MPTGTVRLHRVLRTRPEKIYRAFLDGEALRQRERRRSGRDEDQHPNP